MKSDPACSDPYCSYRKVAEAFPVDDVSPPPWVVERSSIAWMVREGPKGPQIGNFILEADARWVADARNTPTPAEGREAVREAEGIDVERLARALVEVDVARIVEGTEFPWWELPPRSLAEVIAREYAALARTGGSTK